MKKTVLITILIALTVALAGCGARMSDEDFNTITEEWVGAMLVEAFNPDNGDLSEKEIENLSLEKLKEVCKKHGFSLNDYKRKAKTMNKELPE